MIFRPSSLTYDLREAIPLLRQNAKQSPWASRVDVMELQWGDTVPEPLKHADLVICCDCVYEPKNYKSLVDCLTELQARQYAVAWISRGKKEERFVDLLKCQFQIERMPTMTTGIGHALAGFVWVARGLSPGPNRVRRESKHAAAGRTPTPAPWRPSRPALLSPHPGRVGWINACSGAQLIAIR